MIASLRGLFTLGISPLKEIVICLSVVELLSWLIISTSNPDTKVWNLTHRNLFHVPHSSSLLLSLLQIHPLFPLPWPNLFERLKLTARLELSLGLWFWASSILYFQKRLFHHSLRSHGVSCVSGIQRILIIFFYIVILQEGFGLICLMS